MKKLLVAVALASTFGCQNASKPAQGVESAQPVASASAPPPAASSAPTEAVMPKVGDPAPALVATASNGTKVDVAAIAKSGKHVVVYFYPKDDTPGCTKEACAFRDAWTKLEKGNVQIIGVSADDDASHKAFAEKHKLPFPLVADVDLSIAKRFGVPVKNGYESRVSFLIGPDGKIKKVYPKVDPAVHCDEILADAGVT
ncbi:MAG: peroxiredoxin [Polyangiales bacterium]